MLWNPGREKPLLDHAVNLHLAKSELGVKSEVLFGKAGVKEFRIVGVDAERDSPLEVGSGGMARNGTDDSCPQIRENAKLERNLVFCEVIYGAGSSMARVA